MLNSILRSHRANQFAAAASFLFVLYCGAFAQSVTPSTEDDETASHIIAPVPVYFTRDDKKPEDTSRPARIKRWFEFENFAVSFRYRYTRNGLGTTTNAVQYQFGSRARFKFDKKGRYSVVASLNSGNSFLGGWNNTGWGTGDVQTNLYLKQLYFVAKPIKSLEFQIGGLGVNNGENTEVTGYDNDAYITGERIIIRNPKKLYFDEISLTNAHLGDLNRPSVFRRFDNLAKSNYHQFLFRKQVNKRVAFSADYTFDSGSDTLRQAVKIKAPETRVVDMVGFENYQRFDGPGRYGFNLFGEKKIGKKFTLTGGFARIDGRLLNGDRYPQGNLLHAQGVYRLTPEFSFSSVIIQGVGPMLPNLSRTRFELIFTYNILETLRRHKLQ